MKLRCLRKFLTCDQLEKIGLSPGAAIEHAITPGRDYVALGLSLKPHGSPKGSGLFVYIVNDWGQCRNISIRLFDIIDTRCSKHWRISNGDDGTMLLWPEEFYVRYFLDDLSEEDGKAKDVFRSIEERMNAEHEDLSS